MRKCPICGCPEFLAHQIVRVDVVVNGDGDFIENVPGGVYDAEKPYGPFTCCSCGWTFSELSDLDDRLQEVTQS